MIYSGKYKVTSPFGERILNGAREFHGGVDVVGLSDKHVCAVADGYVAVSQIVTDKSNPTWQWGNYVCVIGDDGRQYYYCHLSRRLVSAGQKVRVGDHVGVEGNTGYSFGAHCHFEVRESGGKAIDPAKVLGIPNALGEYGVDYRAECQKKYGFSDGTMKYLDGYEYANDLYRKLVERG